jgi:glycosyltransferase involved in cell wall biosynthesis
MPDFCEAVDLVISPSQGMEKVMRKFGVQSPSEVVPNGVDMHPVQQAEPLSRADFGFIEEDILLVYAGRLAPEKNLEFLIRSFAGVAQVIPNLYLLIVGGGQKQFEDELKLLPSRLEIGNRVRFVGMVSYDRLPSYLAMCDAFVTASVTEVHPLSVIEAMGTGLPILGIDSPGVGDSISDCETGLLATNDMASFTARMTYLCMNGVLRKRMGNAARQASEQYDIERTTRIMLQHYIRLTENPKPAKRRLDERLRHILEEFMK